MGARSRKIGEWYDAAAGGDPFERSMHDRLVRVDDPTWLARVDESTSEGTDEPD